MQTITLDQIVKNYNKLTDNQQFLLKCLTRVTNTFFIPRLLDKINETKENGDYDSVVLSNPANIEDFMYGSTLNNPAEEPNKAYPWAYFKIGVKVELNSHKDLLKVNSKSEQIQLIEKILVNEYGYEDNFTSDDKKKFGSYHLFSEKDYQQVKAYLLSAMKHDLPNVYVLKDQFKDDLEHISEKSFELYDSDLIHEHSNCFMSYIYDLSSFICRDYDPQKNYFKDECKDLTSVDSFKEYEKEIISSSPLFQNKIFITGDEAFNEYLKLNKNLNNSLCL